MCIASNGLKCHLSMKFILPLQDSTLILLEFSSILKIYMILKGHIVLFGEETVDNIDVYRLSVCIKSNRKDNGRACFRKAISF